MGKPIRRLARDTPHQVYRLADGSQVVGASTIAKVGEDAGGLIHWAWKLGMEGKDYKQVRDSAGDSGTVAHFMIECHLMGEEPDLSEFTPEAIDKAENVYLKFLSWWDEAGLTFVSAEEQLVSETYRYGGTLDIQCRDVFGSRVLLDTKTSKAIFLPFLVQLAGYNNLANENHPDDPVKRRAIIRFPKGEKSAMEIKWVPEIDLYFDIFKAQLLLLDAKSRAPKIKQWTSRSKS